MEFEEMQIFYLFCVLNWYKHGLLLIYLKNCDLWVQADRLGILGGPSEVSTGFRLRIPGGPFDCFRRSVWDL